MLKINVCSRAAGALVALAGSVFLAAPAAPAQASKAGVAVWNAYNKAGGSTCQQIAATTVRCNHSYHSWMIDPVNSQVRQTCTATGLNTAPAAVDTSTCAATLSGPTSGPGKLVTESGAVCDTLGSGTVQFHIDTLFGPYDMTIPVVENNEVVTYINAEQATTDGLFVQVLNAKYTGGCGVRTTGEFVGTWKLVSAVQ